MKFFVIVFISFLSLYASDIQRLDEIVNEINLLDKTNNKGLEKRITRLEIRVKELALAIGKKQKVIVKTIIKEKDDNTFPKLQMKPKFFKSGTFRLSKDANIYDEKNGEILYTWEEGTSFTSSKRTDKMIKVTGYFVDKIWRSSEKAMWVKNEDAFER